MINILITGANGFIGRHLSCLLLEKYNLLTPSSKTLDLTNEYNVDLFFKKNEIDYIIHLAYIGVQLYNIETKDFTNANFQMFKHLAKHTSKKCPMIVTGSGAEYDKNRDIIKIKEDDFGKKIPSDPYGYSKYLISKYIETHNYILNLRIFGVYGLHENLNRVTSSIIMQNLASRPIILNQNVIFDFIYIDDLCKIIAYFINHPTDEKFINLTPSESIEIINLAKIINNLSAFKSEIIIKKPGYNKEYTGSNARLLQNIDNFNFTSYEVGMKLLYEKIKHENNVRTF